MIFLKFEQQLVGPPGPPGPAGLQGTSTPILHILCNLTKTLLKCFIFVGYIGPPGIKGERGKDGDKGEIVSYFLFLSVKLCCYNN